MSSNAEYDSKQENRAAFRLALYILWFVLISSMLLAVNTWMIYALCQGTAKLLPSIDGIAFALQAFIFIGPMVLLYLEWFAWDVLFAQLSIRRSSRRS